MGAALALAAVLLLAAPPVAHPARLIRSGLWELRVTAADGTGLTLFRYLPAGASRGQPVLLIPELGFTHAAFDVEGFGLAPFLQREGHEVFVLEPRGHGSSDEGTSLQDIARLDVPAALAEVRRVAGAVPDVIGHGFGGSLALAAVAVAGEADARRFVAVAVPIEPQLPNDRLISALSGGRAFGAEPDTFEFLFHRGARMPVARVDTLRSATSRPLTASVRSEWLEWMRSGDLPLGTTTLGAQVRRLNRETYVVLPLLDYVAHPEFCAVLRDERPGLVEVRILSKLYLHAEDYTHLSVLLGEGAPADVFEPIRKFLEDPR